MSKTLSIFYQSHKICGFWKVELPPFHKYWPETPWQTLSSPQTHGSTPCSAKSDAAWAKVPKIPENYWPLNSPNIWCILPMALFCSIEILLSSQNHWKQFIEGKSSLRTAFFLSALLACIIAFCTVRQLHWSLRKVTPHVEILERPTLADLTYSIFKKVFLYQKEVPWST